MAKSQQTFNKLEKEKKKRKKKQDKAERREQRKLEKEQRGKLSFEDQLSYVDEWGNITDTPPDPKKKNEVKAKDIILGAANRGGIIVEKQRTGKVSFFNHDKGFGFIMDSKSNDRVFVHINQVEGEITENDNVSFETENGPKGLSAVLVKKI